MRIYNLNCTNLFVPGIVCLLLFVSLISCGRRGDPAIPKYDRPVIKKETVRQEEKVSPEKTSSEAEEAEKTQETSPGRPLNVTAIYNGRHIVLVWDEVKEIGVEFYRVYRSEDGDYDMIAETEAPAFTDRNVKPGVRYNYKIGAVGISEGPLSEKTEITAEVR